MLEIQTKVREARSSQSRRRPLLTRPPMLVGAFNQEKAFSVIVKSS